jgi:hypothetical protein
MITKFLLSLMAVVVIVVGVWWFLNTPAYAPSDISPSPSISALPTTTASPLPPITGQGSIILTSPKNGDLVDSPILVTGQARAFENQFMVQLQDGTGKVIYQTGVMADGEGDIGEWRNFKLYIPVPAGSGQNFKVEAIEYSAKGDGSLGGYGSADVKLKSAVTSTVNVAFSVNGQTDCTSTKTFSRTIVKTQSVGLVSLLELLKGPTEAEKAKGAYTAIPDGVKVRSLRISGTTAYADFDYNLDAGVGGSCRVQAIRAQITDTLKQFITIYNVVISIDGRTEDILQP